MRTRLCVVIRRYSCCCIDEYEQAKISINMNKEKEEQLQCD